VLSLSELRDACPPLNFGQLQQLQKVASQRTNPRSTLGLMYRGLSGWAIHFIERTTTPGSGSGEANAGAIHPAL
jgi:hypothetical protein